MKGTGERFEGGKGTSNGNVQRGNHRCRGPKVYCICGQGSSRKEEGLDRVNRGKSGPRMILGSIGGSDCVDAYVVEAI